MQQKTAIGYIYRALKPGGVFIVDVFSEDQFANRVESWSYNYFPDGGFWHEKAHVCLHASYLYEDNVAADQYVIVSDDSLHCYRVWEDYFSQTRLTEELVLAGFSDCGYYGDIAGKTEAKDSCTLCVTARKPK